MFNRRPTTVEGAIQGLLQAVSDLEYVAEVCGDRRSVNRAEVERLTASIETDTTEMDQAMAIAGKLRAITEG